MKYKFNTLKDRAVVTLSAAAGVAACGAGLSVIFTPLAMGIAGVIGVAAAARDALPAYRKRYINREVKARRWQPVPADAPISHIVAEISGKLGTEVPRIYTVGHNGTAAKFKLPRFPQTKKKTKLAEKNKKVMFGAVSGTNTLVTTNEALNNGMTESELRFIAAHEISHLQAKDNLSLGNAAKTIVKKAGLAVFVASIVAAGASLAGVTLPVFATGSFLMTAMAATQGSAAAIAMNNVIVGAMVAANSWIWPDAIANIGKRTTEQRADRNALAITRDLESGKNALLKTYRLSEPEKFFADEQLSERTNYFNEIFQTHPSYNRRIKIMTKAFEKVSKKPPQGEVATAPVAAAQQQQQPTMRV